MIPENEYNERIKKLIPGLKERGRADRVETEELFLLYNDRFKPHESGKHCAGCRQRVFKRLLKYYESLNK